MGVCSAFARFGVALLVIGTLASPAGAQSTGASAPLGGIDSRKPVRAPEPTAAREVAPAQVGKRIGAGGIGAPSSPAGRISNRIQSRLQNRLETRVERFGDLSASMASPFTSSRAANNRGKSATPPR